MEINKVKISMKNPENYAIKCFKVSCPNTKNNFTNVIIVGALVGLCPRGLHTDIKGMKRSRSP